MFTLINVSLWTRSVYCECVSWM